VQDVSGQTMKCWWSENFKYDERNMTGNIHWDDSREWSSTQLRVVHSAKKMTSAWRHQWQWLFRFCADGML